MDWVAIDVHISGDAVTHRIADRFNIRTAEAAGLLLLAFAGMAQHAQDGELSTVTDSQIEEWARWHGKRGAFASFFRAELCDDDGQVRAWEKYNGANIREAKASRARMLAYRAKKKSEREALANANGTPNGTAYPMANGTANVTPNGTRNVHHNRTGQDRTGPNQEAKSIKAKSGGKPRRARSAWADRLAEHWHSRVGSVSPSVVARLLTVAVAERGEAAILRGMDSWIDVQVDKGKDPVLKWFAEVAVAAADKAAMPLVDADGIPTARGQAILAGHGV